MKLPLEPNGRESAPLSFSVTCCPLASPDTLPLTVKVGFTVVVVGDAEGEGVELPPPPPQAASARENDKANVRPRESGRCGWSNGGIDMK